MQASDLIKQLSALPTGTAVYLLVDGEVFPVSGVGTVDAYRYQNGRLGGSETLTDKTQGDPVAFIVVE